MEKPNKKDVANYMLNVDVGKSFFVHLDPRGDDVIVPDWFKTNKQLVLQIGIDMAIPIPDLELSNEGIVSTLSFSGKPFCCFLPWHSVFSIVNIEGKGIIWPEDVPEESEVVDNKTKLSLVPGSKNTKATEKSDSDSKLKRTSNRPPYLKVIK